MVLIKQNNHKTINLRINRNKLIYVLLILLLSFFAGYYARKHLLIYIPKINNFDFAHIYQTPYKYIKGVFTKTHNLEVSIKFSNFQKLAYQRELALKLGPVYRIDKRNMGFVPCKIDCNGKRVKAKIRLKGWMSDHYRYPLKWSFKVKLKGENSFLGMKRFALQHPRVRNYLNEWVYTRFLLFNDVLAPKYDFIEFSINGKNYGIYAVEEAMEKQLLERNQRQEGPIFNLDLNQLLSDSLKYNVYGNWFSTASILPYGESKIKNSLTLKKQFEVAKTLINGVRNNKLKIHDVFDIEKFAKLFAISDLFGHFHGASMYNLKLYYNPISSRIEPIGFDQEAITDITSEGLCSYNKRLDINGNINYGALLDINDLLFTDTIFYKTYIMELENISNKDMLDDFFINNEKEMNKRLNIIYKEFPAYGFNNKKKVLYDNQIKIREILTPDKALIVNLISFDTINNKLVIEISNISKLVLEISNIVVENITIPFNNNNILNPYNGRKRKFIVKEIDLPNNLQLDYSNLENIYVEYAVYGSKYKEYSQVNLYKHIDERILTHDALRLKPNQKNYSFIKKRNDTLIIETGYYILKTPLIIPKGVCFKIEKGVKLDLMDSSFIISYSPLLLKGTLKEPIFILSSDTSGMGIFVINTKRNKSFFQNSVFTNLGNIKYGNWSLTGSLTFYASDVIFNNCFFNNNRDGDDNLNIKRSSFSILNCFFNNSFSDAFDGDFCKGSIRKTVFINIGNDAIDVSGSEIVVDSVEINKAGDKAISAGENSILTGKSISVQNSSIAIAAKDNSRIIINYVIIENTDVGFTAFQKKPEYGPGYIVSDNTKLTHVNHKYLIENNSSAIVNDKQINAYISDVKDLMYGVKYGKSSARK